MKILALVGSYRKRGNTARIVAMIAEELQKLATTADEILEVETVYLAHQDIGLCRGCRVCFDQGEELCPLRDDLLAIKTRMEEADGFIIASPVYVHDVNGVVKNWIDRLAFVCHRPEFKVRLSRRHRRRQPDQSRLWHVENSAEWLGSPHPGAGGFQDGGSDGAG